jgi:putative oxidoreductase
MPANPIRYTEVTYALMRFVLGAMFVCHGVQKLFGAFGEPAAGKPLMMAGGVIELLAGILIALGLMTRAAAFIASGEMAVAYFMSHAPRGFWPIANGGEKAVLYCFAFLFIAAYGGGRYSLDAVFHRASAAASSPTGEVPVGRQVTAAAPRV